MRDSKARMLRLICLLFMTAAGVVYGFDIPEEPVIRIGGGDSGRGGTVRYATFSPDGRYLAVTTSLGVEIRDAHTREELKFLPGAGTGPVVFNHQSTLFVTGNGMIWDTADFTKIASVKEMTLSVFTPDDRLLITGHGAGTAVLWDTEDWQKVRTYSSKFNLAYTVGLSICPDGKLLCASFSRPIAAGADPAGQRGIIIWEIESGREIKILVDDVVTPDTVAFSPDGAILATHVAGHILLWETQTWGEVARVIGGGGCYSCLDTLEFQPGTRLLAFPSGYSYSVELWDTEVVAKVRGLSRHATHIRSVSFHPNGKLLATVSFDGDMKLCDITSGEEIEMTPHSSPVAALTFGQDSGILLSCGETRGTMKYNLVTGETESIIPAEGGQYTSMDFGATGSLLAVTSSGLVTIYDTDTGEVERSLGGGNATFSYDGNTLVTLKGAGPWRHAATLWDVRTWEARAEITLTDISRLFKVEIGDEGRTLAVLTNNQIQIWDVATNQKESVFPNDNGGFSVNMVLSNSGKLLAADGIFDHRGAVKVWDVRKGEVLYILNKAIGPPTLALAFSPDEKILVTGGTTGEMALWDMEDGEMLRLYHEHSSKVSSFEFSPDGRYLASGAKDGLILIWEVNADVPGATTGMNLEGTALVRWGALRRTALLQNFPNPFNPDTWIPYQLARDGEASIGIYDVAGQVVRTLELGYGRTGHGTAHWDGRDDSGESLASGIYFYVLRADDGSGDMKKMTILK